MCKLHSFTIYIQAFTLNVLTILSTLIVSGGELYCELYCLPHACGCATLAQAIQALTFAIIVVEL